MKIYTNSVDSEWYKQRLIGMVFVVMAAFSVLIVRLFYLQVIEGEEFRRLSENNCIRLQAIDPPRGLIFDRNHELLVDNRPSFDLSLIPKDTKNLKETLETLSKCIHTPPEELMAEVKRFKGQLSYKPILLKKDIGRDLLGAVEVHKYTLPGVVVDVRPLRHYIHEKSSSHLLGYIGEANTKEIESKLYPEIRSGDYIGKFGVEKVYENMLRGTRGGRQVEVNAIGQVVRVIDTVEALPGNNIALTIDLKLQQKAEELLQDKIGAIVALDPSNGEVLALANSPSFDQNIFVGGISSKAWQDLLANPHKPMVNKVTQGEYPPASTYKIVTALAGLEEGVININSEFFCPGFYRFGDRTFQCWRKGGHGHVNVLKALAVSCDVFFYQVGQKLGVERLAWYAKGCGLGAPTGIDLDRESGGLIPSVAWKKKRYGQPWHSGETLSIAIGQGYNLTTPLQMAVLIAAIANDGVRYKPIVLKSAIAPDGQPLAVGEPAITGRLPISQRTLSIVKKGLYDVVNSAWGTGKVVRLDTIEICGKTGTAQLVSRKAGERGIGDSDAKHLQPHAWFVAFAPYINPKIAVSVIVEHGSHGSSAAGPIARDLIKKYLLNEG